MKIEVCERKEVHKEICEDLKYCCGTMRMMEAQHHIEFYLNQSSASVILRLRADDYMPDHFTLYGGKEVYLDRIPISFCPFCGEKIE